MSSRRRVGRRQRAGSGKLRLLMVAAVIVVAVGMAVAALAKPVLAHGIDRTLQQPDVAVGPYRLTIWTAPSRLHTGNIHVETALVSAAGETVHTAAVYVTVMPAGQAAAVQSAVGYPVQNAGQIIHEAALRIDEPGRYRIEVTVVDGAGVSGRTAFEVEVRRVALLTKFLIYLQIVAALLTGFWLVRQGLRVWIRHPVMAG